MLISLTQKAKMALLVDKKVKIANKYSDFLDVFFKKKVLILSKAINLNNYIIKLQENQQLFYRPIYSLGLVKFKILKIYIKTNLANGFILPLKLLANAYIFFI